MKKSLSLLLLLASLATLLAGCGVSDGAFSGLTASLVGLTRRPDGQIEATLRFTNPNLAIYNFSKTTHKLALDGTAAGTIAIDRPFGMAPQSTVEKTGILRVSAGGAATLATAESRGSAAYRLDSSLLILVYGDDRQTVHSTYSGTAAFGAK